MQLNIGCWTSVWCARERTQMRSTLARRGGGCRFFWRCESKVSLRLWGGAPPVPIEACAVVQAIGGIVLLGPRWHHLFIT
eukprot:9483953-Pyramimonas_sp.AAC.1